MLELKRGVSKGGTTIPNSVISKFCGLLRQTDEATPLPLQTTIVKDSSNRTHKDIERNKLSALEFETPDFANTERINNHYTRRDNI